MVTAPENKTDLTVIAHRGFAGIAPENTLAAARLASDLGADAIELDVVATVDGTPVVFHDRRLDDRGTSRGITDATGVVADRSTSTVTGAHVLGTDQTIPTLAAFVEAVPNDVILNVELKRPSTTAETPASSAEPDGGLGQERWQPFVNRVMERIDRRRNDVLYSSFSQTALKAVRSRSADARVAPIARDVDTATTMAAALDTRIIHPALDGLRSVQGDSPLRGYTVNAWTARTWQDADDAVQFGVDGLITDYPSVPSAVFESDRSG
ncbi:glycerophosphodiester phosphodiesterase [Halopenitus persicus]|uniref:Glycerophosphoryl diester phosphodiesterase n=1 Tax=Halopenitus persicus TaxID=1048396 RepID=A0A1H3E1J3_9EURY|nr:glycerophosphodiester phosphodiesterase [Halopenitus persicus]SDX72507.1 glycerophosphoryl diester phosphodiesterase [Halopenitus persicus]